MVLKPDGSKYACQSCLKGHRVSACTHVERELIFVPKKGRPVTQCQHCRQERKKRSAHVKCDCGEAEKPHHPREKCIHLREAEERAKAGFHDDHAVPNVLPHVDKDSVTANLLAVAEEQGCCCHHGGKCTCSIVKKEVDQDRTAPHGPAVKPRLEKNGSDSSITVFSNGHHKPVHRKNHAAHECGLPYKMPMPRPSLTDHASATAHVPRRSIDSLALDVTNPYQPSSFLPLSISANNNFMPGRKASASELSDFSNLQMTHGGINESHYPLTQTQTAQSIQSTVSDAMSYSAFDPLSSTTDASFDPWSAYPSADSVTITESNPFAGWSLPIAEYNVGQPALTAGSSGTQSEADEIPTVEDVYSFGMPSIQEQDDIGTASGESNGNSPQRNRRSLPASFFGNMEFNVSGTDGSDWEAPQNGVTQSISPDPKSKQNSPFAQYDESWQMSQQSSNNQMVQQSLSQQQQQQQQRQLPNLQTQSRSASVSLGHTNAPSEDIIRQLFPDIDVDGGIFGPSSNVTQSPTANLGGQDSLDTTSRMNYGPTDTVGFAQQSWTDGSVSMPNDEFSPGVYDVESDYVAQQQQDDYQQQQQQQMQNQLQMQTQQMQLQSHQQQLLQRSR